MKRILLAAIVCALFGSVWAGDLEDAKAAFQKSDYAKAVPKFKALAARGNAEGQAHVGFFYVNGILGNKNYVEGAKWFTLASKQGNGWASFWMGLISESSDGGELANHVEAVKWFKLAASQGYYSALSALGMKYRWGDGVTQDYVKAHMWLNLAAARDESAADRNRDDVAKLMTTQQVLEAQKLARECHWRNYKDCD
jgi:hypothetical protein